GVADLAAVFAWKSSLGAGRPTRRPTAFLGLIGNDNFLTMNYGVFPKRHSGASWSAGMSTNLSPEEPTMEITVRSILPCDHTDLPKIGAIVHFADDRGDYQNSATVEVFIDKQDLTLSGLKSEAVRAAVAFLNNATEKYRSR